jgi:hypothetical protein
VAAKLMGGYEGGVDHWELPHGAEVGNGPMRHTGRQRRSGWPEVEEGGVTQVGQPGCTGWLADGRIGPKSRRKIISEF